LVGEKTDVASRRKVASRGRGPGSGKGPRVFRKKGEPASDVYLRPRTLAGEELEEDRVRHPSVYD
jgi:hypothetical protein